MNNRSSVLLSLTAVVFASASSARAQEASAPTFTRPRVVSAAQQSQSAATPAQTPASPQRTPAQTSTTGTQPSPNAPRQQQTAPASQQGTNAQTPTTSSPAQYPYVAPAVPLQPARPLSLTKFKERAAEAQKLLTARRLTL